MSKKFYSEMCEFFFGSSVVQITKTVGTTDLTDCVNWLYILFESLEQVERVRIE